MTAVHPTALCESPRVGPGTTVGAFAHVMEGAVIGEGCELGAHVFLDDGVVLGARVVVRPGVQLHGALRVDDDVTIGPGASFPPGAERLLGVACVVGANATILPGVRVGERAVVEAGAVVSRSVPPTAIVAGNPAQIVGYVDSVLGALATSPELLDDEGAPPQTTSVSGVTVHRFPFRRDLRGSLTVVELASEIPFAPRRFFMVFDAPSAEVRGEHAHRRCHQFLVCVSGSCSVVTDDGEHREEFRLDSNRLGLYVPPLVWAVQYKHEPGTTLAVLASDPYDPDDYIRDYAEFLALRASG